MRVLGLLLLCLAAAQSLPRKRSTDVERVPVEKQTSFGSLNPGHGDYPEDYDNERTTFGSPFEPFGSPFASFGSPFRTWPSFSSPYLGRWFMGVQESMRRMRDQMDQMWRQVAENSENATVVDLNKVPGNTTSETQVINGNVVTRNVTTYKSGDNGASFVIQVQSIDVKPVNERTPEQESKPVEHIPGTDGTSSIPHEAETEGASSIPHEAETEGASSVPHEAKTDSTPSVPHEAKTDGTPSVPHEGKSDGTSPVTDSLETDGITAEDVAENEIQPFEARQQ